MDVTWPAEWGQPKRLENVYDLKDGDVVHAYVSRMPGACLNCGDTSGLMYAFEIRVAAKSTHWFADESGRGRLVHSSLTSRPCPVCRGSQTEAWLLRNSGIGGMYVGKRLAAAIQVIGAKPVAGQEDAWAAAARCLAELPEAESWLMLVGEYGTGKTHVLCGMVNACRKVGVLAKYATTDRLINELQETFDDHSLRTTDQVRREYETVPVLVLDEFHRIRWSDWAGQQVFSVLNERYSYQRPVWLASNEGPETLAAKAEPLAGMMSRMKEGQIAVLTAADLRDGEHVDWSEPYATH